MGKQNKGLNKQRFRGQFKISNTDYELSGDLFFDLSDGIKLISMVTDGHMRATPDGGLSITRYFEENQISVIHGILEDSRDCTLLGHISCTSTNYYGNGLVNIEICANHIVFGKHLEDSILYNTVNFSITGLDEFYGITKHTPCSYPQTIDSVRHLINLDDSHQVENLNLDDIMFVSNSALKEVIDIEVKKELSNREKNIVFKSNKKKIIHLEYKNPVTLDQVTSDTLLLSNLIAFLINSPTLPFDVSVFDEGSTKPLNILTSRIRNEDTLNMIRGENEHG